MDLCLLKRPPLPIAVLYPPIIPRHACRLSSVQIVSESSWESGHRWHDNYFARNARKSYLTFGSQPFVLKP